MSSCWPSRMIGGSITQEIAASPAIVWEVATDRDNAACILTNLVSKRIVKHGNKDGVGMVVHEVRKMNGHTLETFNKITAIHASLPYSVSTNVYLSKSNAISGKDMGVRTGGWTILEGATPNSSVFVWTFSAIPSSDFVVESFCYIVCNTCIMGKIKQHFEQDLQDFAIEAEKRQAIIDSNNTGMTSTEEKKNEL